MFSITKTFTFHAAHRLHQLPKGHKCRELHGHSYKVEVTVEACSVGERDRMVVDFAQVKELVNKRVKLLDHAVLVAEEDEELVNALESGIARKVVLPVQATTAEEIAKWITHQLWREVVKLCSQATAIKVSVWETETAMASYRMEV